MPILRVTAAAASLFTAFAWMHTVPAPSTVMVRHIAGALPIKGSVSGTVKATLITAPATYRLEVSAAGPISLGGVARSSWELPEVTLDLPGGVLRLKHASWNGSLEVANGDRLLGRYTFRSTELRVSPNGDFTTIADVAVTGGTGRFAGSTGTCVSNIRGNVHARTVTVDFAGEVAIRGK